MRARRRKEFRHAARSAFSNPAMSCPLCGDPAPSRATAARTGDLGGQRCTCSHTEAASFLIDPEAYDRSEECFAASLEGIEPERSSPGRTRRAELQSCAAADCGVRSALCEQPESETGEENEAVEQGAFWKQEVTSRLESFRARRRRPHRERSLPLDFERAVNREMAHAAMSARVAEPAPPATIEPEPAAAASVVPEPALPDPEEPDISPRLTDVGPEEAGAVPEEESNLIQFPRYPLLPVMPPSSEELAEPILDRPRILEVPEEVDAEAPLSDISVAPELEQRPPMEFELPLLVASMSRRLLAGLVDAVVVMAAAALFAAIALKLGVPVPRDKAGLLLAMAVPALLWAVYEYIFLLYATTTLGMQVARLQLITFDGERPRRRSRRGRALAMMMSTLSLGLGVAWALLDEDTLCWHDRITRTYLVAGS